MSDDAGPPDFVPDTVSGVLSDRYRVAIVGSRESPEADLVFRVVRKLVQQHGRLVVVSGGSPGGGIDHYARAACWNAGFHFCNAALAKGGKMRYRPIDLHDRAGVKDPLHFVEFPVEDIPIGTTFGQRAYYRNIKVVRSVDMVVAIYAPGKRTPGTTSTIRVARELEKVTHVWHPDGGWVDYTVRRQD